ncbi:ornithine transcarbamylase, mitochondrial-like isoform X2 [Styela clava]
MLHRMWIHRTLPRCNTLRCVTDSRKQSTSPKSVASTNHAQIFRQQDISMKGRSLLSLADYTREDLLHLLSSAADLKLRMKQLNERFRKLEGKSLGMIFKKTSTRTKLSTEIGMNLLGGHSCVIPYEDVQGNANGGVYSKLFDCILARITCDAELQQLHKCIDVPVINGSSEMSHPLQILADFLTLIEYFGNIKRKSIGWVGDGNNIIHTLMISAPKLGMNLQICTPKMYRISSKIASHAAELAKYYGTRIDYYDDPSDAVGGTNAIVTDLWNNLPVYPLTKKMCDTAADDWCFLHCLPWKPKDERDEWFYSDKCLIYKEIENRKWTIMVSRKVTADYVGT